MNTAVISKNRLSIKSQTLYAFIAVIAAVAVPQIFHAIGYLSSAGTAAGEIFLPMHLPIILVGLLAGQYAGAAAGILAPLASFAFTTAAFGAAMPAKIMLPFMCAELLGYGLCAGLLSKTKMPMAAKVLLTQIGGRALRFGTVAVAIFAFDSPVALTSVWTATTKGLAGIVLQLVLIPLVMYRIENGKSNEQ